ncbi:hypothetical protein Tco_0578378 [Tanacetum coccineum]
MTSTRASISKVSKRTKINIIPPKQLFVDLTQDDIKTPSPKLQLSSPSAPNAPSKTPSTKDTSSSLIHYIPKSPTSSTSLSPNGYLNPPTPPPLRVYLPPLTQENASMDITLTLSPITPFDVQFDTPSPSPPIFGHPIPWNLLEAYGDLKVCGVPAKDVDAICSFSLKIKVLIKLELQQSIGFHNWYQSDGALDLEENAAGCNYYHGIESGFAADLDVGWYYPKYGCVYMGKESGEEVYTTSTFVTTAIKFLTAQVIVSLSKMLKNFDREDLEVLWRIVKARFKKMKPVDYMDTFLLLTLKTIFEHHVEDEVWKRQQVQSIPYYLLVEKMYPLTNRTLHQMFNDVKHQVDYECEMAFDLLRLVKKQLKEGYVPE